MEVTKTHVHFMITGAVVLLSSVVLWLMEEGTLVAPALFPIQWLPYGGGGSLQAVFATAAMSGFPIAGLALRPQDTQAVRALLRMFVALCLTLGVVFTVTSFVLAVYDNPSWRASGAVPRPGRLLLHVTNAAMAYRYAWHFSRGLDLPPGPALEYVWATGHEAGALLSVSWLVTRLPWVPMAWIVSIEPTWTQWSHMLPSVAVLMYVAFTSKAWRRSVQLLVWRRHGRPFITSSSASAIEATGNPSAVAPPISRPSSPARVVSHPLQPSPVDKMSGELEEEEAFHLWLHPQLAVAEMGAIGGLFLYWVAMSLVSGMAYPEVFVAVVLFALTAARVLGGWHHRDGEAWCMGLLVAHAVEAASVGLGNPHWAQVIAQVRIDYRELAYAVCLIIGAMHGVQPLHLRTRLLVALVFELLFLLWIAPLWPTLVNFVSTSLQGWPVVIAIPANTNTAALHPAFQSDGTITPGYLELVAGCAVSFALGFGGVHALVQTLCKPLWHISRQSSALVEALELRKEQVAAEKERLNFELELTRRQLSRLQDAHDLHRRGKVESCSSSHNRQVRDPVAGGARSSCSDEGDTEGNSELATLNTFQPVKIEGARQACGFGSPPGSTIGSMSELANLPLELDPHACTYPVLPEYRNERAMCDVTYLAPNTVYENHLLKVRDGLLVDARGAPLNAAGTLEDESVLYVLSVQGDLLYSVHPQDHRHSSLVAGAPVQAAGMLRIRAGRLLALDNCSGHYHPASECLDQVEAWFLCHGVRLENVERQVVTPATRGGANTHEEATELNHSASTMAASESNRAEHKDGTEAATHREATRSETHSESAENAVTCPVRLIASPSLMAVRPVAERVSAPRWDE